jgi:hypothetical protein
MTEGPDLLIHIADKEISEQIARGIQEKAEGQAGDSPEIYTGGYTEQQLDQYIDSMVNAFAIPPLEVRPALVQLLHRRRVAALIISNYEGAEIHDRCLEIYRYTLKQETDRMSDSERIDALYQRWLQLQQDQDEVNERWDAKTSQYSQDDQERFDELMGRHADELKKHDEFWQDPINLRPFMKPSPRLLQLREQERAMAISRLYAQAKDMKQFADTVQKEETAAAQQRIARQMAVDKQKLLKRQENERNRHLTHRRSVLNTMEYERTEELRPIVTAMSQMRQKKNGVIGVRASTATSRSREATQLATPRTQEQYALYRAQKRVALLPVQPITDESKPESRATKSRRETRVSDMEAIAPPLEPPPQEVGEPVPIEKEGENTAPPEADNPTQSEPDPPVEARELPPEAPAELLPDIMAVEIPTASAGDAEDSENTQNSVAVQATSAEDGEQHQPDP